MVYDTQITMVFTGLNNQFITFGGPTLYNVGRSIVKRLIEEYLQRR